jgi:hypothetical protein
MKANLSNKFMIMNTKKKPLGASSCVYIFLHKQKILIGDIGFHSIR